MIDLTTYLDKNVAGRTRVADAYFKALKRTTAKQWSHIQQRSSLATFKTTVHSVAAYASFIARMHIRPQKIKTFKDFLTLPPVTKANYLRVHPLKRLVANLKTISSPIVFTATSGSTGTPFYFPRNHTLDIQSSLYHETIFRNAGIKPTDNTLVIVGFGMGVWIGGIITYEAIKTVAERGYNISIITPGTNKAEIFAALKTIAHGYTHVVLCGYPPFIKDLVDDAASAGVEWRSYKSLKLICAAEMFTEKFRDYIARKTGVKDPYRDIINIYGSADLGTMAHETPLAILIRRKALKNKRLYQSLFTEASRLPTLAQFNPEFISFDAMNKSVFLTAMSRVPLVRYEIGDHGGVLDYRDIERAFLKEGMDLKKEIKRARIEDTISEMPFVYIYERSDLSTKLYGAIIWPEHIREAFLDESLQEEITGRFTLITRHDKRHNEYLEINIEMHRDRKGSDRLKKRVLGAVTDALLARNAEYTYLSHHMPARIVPRIVFWPHEHPLHFKGGIKQKWVKNNQTKKK